MPVEKFKTHVISDPLQRSATGPGGQVYEIAADALGQVARQVGDIADRAAASAGAIKGSEAGFDPEFRPRRDGTIAGEAFDQAALRSAAVRLDGEMSGQLAAVYERTGHDPLAFREAADGVRTSLFNGMPAEIKPQLEADFRRLRLGYERESVRRVAAATLSEQAKAAEDFLANTEVEQGRLAFQLGLDEDADTTLSEQGAATLTRLLSFGPKEGFTYEGRAFAPDAGRAGLMSVEAIGQQMRALNEGVRFNRVKGAFSRLSGVGVKAAFLREFRGDFADGDGVPGKMTLKTVENLEGWMEASIRNDLSAQREAASAMRAEIADIRSSLTDYRSFPGQGLAIPPGVVAGLTARARATGDPGIVADVDGLASLSDLAVQAAGVDPASLNAAIAARRSDARDGATPQQAAEIRVLEDTLSGMSTALARDPMSWAVRAGVVRDLPPLNVEINPETGQLADGGASLRARRATARTVSDRYGVPFQPFTAEEASVAAALDKAGGLELAAMSGELVKAFGADAQAALAQVSQRAPLLAHLGGLLADGSRMDVIAAAAEGQSLMTGADGVAKGLAATDKAEVLGRPSLQMERVFADAPETRATIERTADAIYVGRKGLNAAWDAGAYERAMQEAAGATFVNGVQFGGIAPKQGRQPAQIAPAWLRSDALDDVLKAMTPSAFAMAGLSSQPLFMSNTGGYPPLSETGEAMDLATVRNKGRLVTAGPGRYWIALKDPAGDDPQFLASANPDSSDGRYVLDLNNIRPWISQRAEWVAP